MQVQASYSFVRAVRSMWPKTHSWFAPAVRRTWGACYVVKHPIRPPATVASAFVVRTVSADRPAMIVVMTALVATASRRMNTGVVNVLGITSVGSFVVIPSTRMKD